MKDNRLPKHGGENIVNMVAGCLGDFRILDIKLVRGDLVKFILTFASLVTICMTMLVVVFVAQIYRVVTR